MGTSNFYIALLGGILCASNLIIARLPRAKEYIDRITPYQGWLGVGMTVWGVINLKDVPAMIKGVGAMPVSMIAAIAMTFLLIACGFILGFGLISKYLLSKNPRAEERGEVLRAKLAPLTGTLGFVLIGCAAWLLLNFYVLKMAI
jgi:hypothetical protein